MVVVWRNDDPLDCHRTNLLVVDPIEEEADVRPAQRNSRSGIRGVSFNAHDRRWVAQVESRGVVRTRTFPGTPEGLRAASAAAVALRKGAPHPPPRAPCADAVGKVTGGWAAEPCPVGARVMSGPIKHECGGYLGHGA